jgi:micrococcal nuclease
MMVCRVATAVVCMCVCMGLAPAGKSTLETPPTIQLPSIEGMQLARVLKVVDGDTILLDIHGKETPFELLAINAPEYIQRDPTPRLFARESWFALNSLLSGESVYIHQDPSYRKTAAGRMTGFVFRSPDLLFVNQEIVRQGYAEHEPRRSSQFIEILSWWQSHARDAEKGIWSSEPAVLIDPTQPEPAVPASVPVLQEPEPTNSIDPDPTEVPTSNEFTVYLTKSGSKYHTKKCRYYSENCRAVQVSDARKQHGACKVCKPDDRED